VIGASEVREPARRFAKRVALRGSGLAARARCIALPPPRALFFGLFFPMPRVMTALTASVPIGAGKHHPEKVG
jgi:hypothetical protein